MGNKLRFLVPLLVFGGLVLLFAKGLELDPRKVPSPLIDKPAPAFELPRLKQPDATLGIDDLKGQVTLLNVWASWCSGCRVEHPFLVKLARSGEIPIYGLNYKDEPADALNWLRRLGDPYTAVAVDRDGRVGIDWGVYGVPETFLIDRDGMIRYKQIGPLDEETWNSVIRPMVERLKAEAS